MIIYIIYLWRHCFFPRLHPPNSTKQIYVHGCSHANVQTIKVTAVTYTKWLLCHFIVLQYGLYIWIWNIQKKYTLKYTNYCTWYEEQILKNKNCLLCSNEVLKTEDNNK